MVEEVAERTYSNRWDENWVTIDDSPFDSNAHLKIRSNNQYRSGLFWICNHWIKFIELIKHVSEFKEAKNAGSKQISVSLLSQYKFLMGFHLNIKSFFFPFHLFRFNAFFHSFYNNPHLFIYFSTTNKVENKAKIYRNCVDKIYRCWPSELSHIPKLCAYRGRFGFPYKIKYILDWCSFPCPICDDLSRIYSILSRK